MKYQILFSGQNKKHIINLSSVELARDVSLILYVCQSKSPTGPVSYHHHIIIRFLINVQVQGQHPHQWLAARMADFTPDLHIFLS